MKKLISRFGFAVFAMLLLGVSSHAQPAARGRGGPPPGQGRRGGAPPSVLEQAVSGLNVPDSKRQEIVAAVRAHDSNVRVLTELASADLVMKLKEVVSPSDFKKLSDAVAALRTAPRGNVPDITEDDLVSRVLAFDTSGQGRITKADLPERMQGLIEQGDANHDQVLDRDELKNLASDRPTAATGRRGGAGANTGNTGPIIGIAPVALERVVGSLNLTGAPKEASATILKAEEETMIKMAAIARSDLLLKVNGMLSDEEFKNFAAILDRQPILGSEANPRRGGPPPNGPPRGAVRGRGGNRGG